VYKFYVAIYCTRLYLVLLVIMVLYILLNYHYPSTLIKSKSESLSIS